MWVDQERVESMCTPSNLYVVTVVVVVTFFNHNFVNGKATLILAIKIYEI